MNLMSSLLEERKVAVDLAANFQTSSQLGLSQQPQEWAAEELMTCQLVEKRQGVASEVSFLMSNQLELANQEVALVVNSQMSSLLVAQILLQQPLMRTTNLLMKDLSVRHGV